MSASDTTAAADLTGNRPASRASFTRVLTCFWNACATLTMVPAPPAFVDGAWWRTHWTVVIAAAPPEVSPRSIASRTTATRPTSQAMPRASTSLNRPARPSGPPPLGACHSTSPSTDSEERAAAIRSRCSVRLKATPGLVPGHEACLRWFPLHDDNGRGDHRQPNWTDP